MTASSEGTNGEERGRTHQTNRSRIQTNKHKNQYTPSVLLLLLLLLLFSCLGDLSSLREYVFLVPFTIW